MDAAEYEQWLSELQEQRRIQEESRGALALQRRLFDERREQIERDFAGLIVGFHRGELVVARSRSQLFAETIDTSDAPLYYEPLVARGDVDRIGRDRGLQG
jgi:hypothetical protein